MYQKKRYMKNLSEKYNFSKWNVFVLWEVPVCTIGCQFSSGVKKNYVLKFLFSKKAKKIVEVFTINLTLFCGLLRKHKVLIL